MSTKTRKTIWIFTIIFLISIITIIIDHPKAKNTYMVDDEPGFGALNPAENFTSINTAVNQCQPGDSIYIFSGIYNENIIINKSINLLGEGYKNVIVDGQEDCFSFIIDSSNVLLENLTIQNADFGVYISLNISNVAIKKCVFSNNSAGVFLQNLSQNNNISNSLFNYNNDGIRMYSSSNNQIRNNIFRFTPSKSLYLSDNCKNNIIASNFFDEEASVVLERWSNNNSIVSNTFLKSDISFRYSSNNIVTDNVISDTSKGIILTNSNNNLITNNSIRDCDIAAIYLDNCEENTLEPNFFDNNAVNIKEKPSPPQIKTPGFDVVTIILTLFLVSLLCKRRYKKN